MVINKNIPFDRSRPVYILNSALTSAYFESTLNLTKKVQFTFPSDIGGGDVNMEYTDWVAGLADFPYDEKYFFYVEPGAMIQVHIAKKIKFNAGLTYVCVPKLSYRAVNASNMTTPSFKIGTKYGRFL